MKNALNDYSALSNLFRDGALGLIISTGITSTLLPNTVESVGQFQELNSFKTLNLFSVVYFVFPVLLMTCYWFLRGSKLYFKEKLDRSETSRFNQLDKREFGKNDVWRAFIILLKLMPIFLFIRDEEYFETGWRVLAFFYLILGLGQLFINYIFNRNWLRHPTLSLDTDRINNLLYRAFCIDGLIFFLDAILGLTLVIFSAPWIFYSSGFYEVCNWFIVVFAVSHWCLSFALFEKERQNTRDFIVTVILCVAGLTFPSVNMHNFGQMRNIVFVVLTVSLLLSSWFAWRRREQTAQPGDHARKLATILLFLVPAFFLVNWFKSVMEKANQNYMLSRYEAAMQIPTNQVYPLKDELRAPDLDKRNRLVSFHPGALKPIHYAENDNLQKHFYGSYAAMEKNFATLKNKAEAIRKHYPNQDSIDSFYNNIYHQVLVKRSMSRKLLKNFQTNPDLNKYSHPLDFMGGRLHEARTLNEELKGNINTAEDLYRLALLKRIVVKDLSMAGDTLVALIDQQARLLQDILKEKFKSSVELQLDTMILHNLAFDSISCARLARLQKLTADHNEREYHALYAKTQTVYRSYLVDSQRVGVWTFLVSIVVIGLAVYMNSQDNKDAMGLEGWPDEEQKLSLDTPRNALFIQCLAISILAVPLIRPIQPQNIDPEKSYWMISLQNWHAPTFIKSFSEPTGEPKYMPGKSAVFTTVNNQINLNELNTTLQELKKAIEGNKVDPQKLLDKLDGIQKQIANGEYQKNGGVLPNP
jgi:hypothetical protein